MTEAQKEQYFDWAATSPADEGILRAALEETIAVWGNPSSLHAAGKEARAVLEAARRRCADALGVPPQTLCFTSGGTESDHIPILSILNRPQKGGVLFSAAEHPAVREQARALQKCGWTVREVQPGKDGIITPQAVLDALTPETALVCIMAVNNETGAIQPVPDIADALMRECRNRRRPKLHVDCVQAAGKIPLDISHAGIDSAAFSAHKLCGPRGIGLLYLSEPLEPFLKGGGQENGIRSGTENLFGAAALARCLETYCITEENTAAFGRYLRQQELTARFVQKLASLGCCTIIPEVRLQAPERYSPWIVQASFANIPGQVMLRALDAEGFCISTGSACSSKKRSRPVLDAMHVPPEAAQNAVRFSFGPATTEAAMDRLFEAAAEIARRFNGR